MIYSAAHSLTYGADYSEWIHFDTGENIKKDIILEAINSVAEEDNKIFLVFGRRDSTSINVENSIEEIMPYLGKENFFMLKKDMSKIIEFKNIGVLRTGITDYKLQH